MNYDHVIAQALDLGPEWPRDILQLIKPRACAAKGNGGPHNLLFWGSARAGEAISDGLITEALAEDMLKEAAHQAGIGEREALSTIASGINAGRGHG
jgi:hypothetical protein